MSDILKLNIDALARVTATRALEFAAALERAGRHNGQQFEISSAVYSKLLRAYKPLTGTAPAAVPRGLGDLVSAIATPIARVLHLPCVDSSTGKLRPDSNCARRRDALNRLTPRA